MNKIETLMSRALPQRVKNVYHDSAKLIKSSPITKYNEQRLVKKFNKFYYHSGALTKMSWLGVPLLKFPTDLWLYQEIIFDYKPDIIIECGTKYGGSALFMASLCDMMNHGKIITIDIEKEKVPKHPRIKYLLGSSTSNKIVKEVEKELKPDNKILVILDSAHEKDHVLNELNIYYKYIKKGGYIIVEDTIVNGHPAMKFHGPGPMEASKEFLKKHKNFRPDLTIEKFYLTQNPKGYLKKIK
ncbi:MAG: CmcI family methyltransferase [Candidatus Nanoarchaeia archaeon]